MKYTLALLYYSEDIALIIYCTGTKVINLAKPLGSQINNFYPHHAGGNQRIEIKELILLLE
jgi:hypothetical protein